MKKYLACVQSSTSLLNHSKLLHFFSAFILFCCLAGCETTAQNSVSTSESNVSIPLISYNTDNYSSTVTELDNVIANKDSDANSIRLANLGKALIYMSNDKSFNNFKKAKQSLKDAQAVSLQGKEKFLTETNMLMDAVVALVSSKSKYFMLRANSSNIIKLQQKNKSLITERNNLLNEQKTLKQAMEKLKQLALDN